MSRLSRVWTRQRQTVASNSGTIFSGLPSLYNHEIKGSNATTVLADLRKRCQSSRTPMFFRFRRLRFKDSEAPADSN